MSSRSLLHARFLYYNFPGWQKQALNNLLKDKTCSLSLFFFRFRLLHCKKWHFQKNLNITNKDFGFI
jgi:hypothetical protein